MKILLFFLCGAWRGNRDFYQFLWVTGVMVAICLASLNVNPTVDFWTCFLFCFAALVIYASLWMASRPDWYEEIEDKEGEKVRFAVYGAEYRKICNGESYWSKGRFIGFAGMDDFDAFFAHDAYRTGDAVVVISRMDGAIIYRPKEVKNRVFVGDSYWGCPLQLRSMFDNGKVISWLLKDGMCREAYCGGKHLYSSFVVQSEQEPSYIDLIDKKLYNEAEMKQKQEGANLCCFALECKTGEYALYVLCYTNEEIRFVCRIVGADEVVCKGEVFMTSCDVKSSVGGFTQDTCKYVLTKNLYRLA
ncbi:MAG: hypothetical protein J6C85_00815 [Alphaproteobacteria bacterium]|nr:hypothetical protein [Alphaproteobacteria bacterium]